MSFGVSVMYIGCVGMSALQCALLLRLVRTAGWLRQIVGPVPEAKRAKPLQGLPVGSPVPGFSVKVAGSNKVFRSRDLKGGPSLLLFLSSAIVSASSVDERSSISFFTSVMSHRLEGRVYVVCSGPEQSCDDICAMFTEVERSVAEKQVAVVLEDVGGFLAHAFGLQRMPAAIRIDERGRIEQYGFPAQIVAEEVPVLASELGVRSRAV